MEWTKYVPWLGLLLVLFLVIAAFACGYMFCLWRNRENFPDSEE